MTRNKAIKKKSLLDSGLFSAVCRVPGAEVVT